MIIKFEDNEMLAKLTKIYEQVINESKSIPNVNKPKRRKRVRIKNIPTTVNMDQFCKGSTKTIKTSLNQKSNVKR